MTKYRVHFVIVGVVLALAALGIARAGSESLIVVQDATHQESHVMFTPDQMKWGPGPPSLPAGAQLSVLNGNPAAAGPFTIRLKFPDGFKIPPHWHPTAENVVVITGTLMFGTGEAFDKAAAKAMSAGSYSYMPQGVRHYGWAQGETIVQVSGTGPFQVTYVNPADDPRKKPAE